MKTIILLSFFLSGTLPAFSQAGNATEPCSEPVARQFDFWLGEWNVTMNDSIFGTNIITKELDGCVIHEKFSTPLINFHGKSFSVYNPGKKQWEQTWVDNTGNYMTFTGNFSDGKMILNRNNINKKGEKLTQRMIFYDITKNSMYWNWESSPDEGKTWKLLLKINYERKK